jgi:predicted metal-dependent hydrolase
MVNGEWDKITARIESYPREELEASILAFLECFDRREYFEAHKVLEPTWLAHRGTTKEGFYKGLIQLAGAFVHLQANRLAPATALLELARRNLASSPECQDGLAVEKLRRRIDGLLVELRPSA